MKYPLKSGLFVMLLGLFYGCGTPSERAGYPDPYPALRDEAQPASLVEVSFGHEGAEVTKSVPEDAVHAVQKAIKSIRGQPVSEP